MTLSYNIKDILSKGSRLYIQMICIPPPPLSNKGKKKLRERQNFTNTNESSEQHLNSHHTTPGKNQCTTASSIMPRLAVLTSFKSRLCI